VLATVARGALVVVEAEVLAASALDVARKPQAPRIPVALALGGALPAEERADVALGAITREITARLTPAAMAGITSARLGGGLFAAHRADALAVFAVGIVSALMVSLTGGAAAIVVVATVRCALRGIAFQECVVVVVAGADAAGLVVHTPRVGVGLHQAQAAAQQE
jgi:hypothetical protein